jgi:hypothetical protein
MYFNVLDLEPWDNADRLFRKPTFDIGNVMPAARVADSYRIYVKNITDVTIDALASGADFDNGALWDCGDFNLGLRSLCYHDFEILHCPRPAADASPPARVFSCSRGGFRVIVLTARVVFIGMRFRRSRRLRTEQQHSINLVEQLETSGERHRFRPRHDPAPLIRCDSRLMQTDDQEPDAKPSIAGRVE